jgi:dihydropteroate synthase
VVGHSEVSSKIKTTKVIGILNITPDSFFDGGKHNSAYNSLEHLEKLILDGADVIDIGAESTRPGAVEVFPDEEWQRLKNILPEIVKYISNHNSKNQRKIEISLDSRHHQTVSEALKLGIDIINDVSGFEDENMIKLAAKSGKKIIVMHNLGVPADKAKVVDENLDIMEVLSSWMKNKLEKLQNNGVKKEQIIFDIGIGFGKNAKQSIELLQKIDSFKNLDLPLCVGHSNKSFLDQLSWDKSWGEATRINKTSMISSYLISKKIDYLRIHDPKIKSLLPSSFRLERSF